MKHSILIIFNYQFHNSITSEKVSINNEFASIVENDHKNRFRKSIAKETILS